MTKQEKRALLTTFVKAWVCADVDALMACITDDCVYSASVGPEPGTTYRGREEARRGFEEILAFESGEFELCRPKGDRSTKRQDSGFGPRSGPQGEAHGCAESISPGAQSKQRFTASV